MLSKRLGSLFQRGSFLAPKMTRSFSGAGHVIPLFNEEAGIEIPNALNDYKARNYGFQIPIEVRWGDMDAMKHVNNTKYFVYFETARLKHFEACNYDLMKEKIQPILSSTSCRFKAPVEYPADLVIGVNVDDIEETSLVQRLAILNRKTGRIVAEGDAGVVFIDYETGKRAKVPQLLIDNMLKLQGKL